MEHGDEKNGCAGENVRYKFEAVMDKNDNYKKTITCTDEKGTSFNFKNLEYEKNNQKLK